MNSTPPTPPPTPRRRGGILGWGSLFVTGLAVIAVGAPWLAPFSPSEQFDPAAGRHLAPFSSRLVIELVDGRKLLAEAADWVPSGLAITRKGSRQLLNADQVRAPGRGEPAVRRHFLLGTDRYGRDVLTRTLWGSRTSLSIGLLAALLALTLGVAIGSLAGMAGKFVDGALMRTVDALLMFPRLFLILALSAVLGATEWVVVAVLGATGWMAASRLVRAELLRLRESDFALAARSIGQRPWKILVRHLLPAALSPVLIETTLLVGNIILAEAALSFLGFGVQPPTPSWGSMIADGADSLLSAWWVTVFPGIAIALTVIGFNFLGDGLRDRMDPRVIKPRC